MNITLTVTKYKPILFSLQWMRNGLYKDGWYTKDFSEYVIPVAVQTPFNAFWLFWTKDRESFHNNRKNKEKNLLCINIRTKAPNVSFRIPAIKIHTRKCCPLQNYVDKMPAKQKEKGVRHEKDTPHRCLTYISNIQKTLENK